MPEHPITELLVAVEGSPRSREAALLVAVYAERLSVPLSLVHCCRAQLSYAKACEELDELASSLGIVKRAEVVHSSDVAGDLLRTAGDLPGSTICLASHGRTEIGTAFLGSISREVVDRSLHPVLLIGPHAEAPDSFATLQIAFNDSPLAWRALEAASAWARQLGATPWITRVDAPGGLGLPPDVSDTGDLRLAAARLDELGTPAEWDVLHGDDPGAVLSSWGATHGAALYAVGAHSRSGLRELFVGSAANQLIHTANRPVLIAGGATL
jgi:nucleotide-binding universal stress UspA family protein